VCVKFERAAFARGNCRSNWRWTRRRHIVLRMNKSTEFGLLLPGRCFLCFVVHAATEGMQVTHFSHPRRRILCFVIVALYLWCYICAARRRVCVCVQNSLRFIDSESARRRAREQVLSHPPKGSTMAINK
jgi:hypothetical protein